MDTVAYHRVMVKRTLNDIASESILKYRQAQDLLNTGGIDHGSYSSIVKSVYEICAEVFPTLKQAPHQHTYQMTRAINVASIMIQRSDPSWA